MVRVIYRDQTETLFDSNNYYMSNEQPVFKIFVGTHYVMIPIDEVRCIGCGHIEEKEVAIGNVTYGSREEFVYE